MAVNASLPLASESTSLGLASERNSALEDGMCSISSRTSAQHSTSARTQPQPQPQHQQRHTFIVTSAAISPSSSSAAQQPTTQSHQSAASAIAGASKPPAAAASSSSSSSSRPSTTEWTSTSTNSAMISMPTLTPPPTIMLPIAGVTVKHQRASSELSTPLSVDTQHSSASGSPSQSPSIGALEAAGRAPTPASALSSPLSGSGTQTPLTPQSRSHRAHNSASVSSSGASPLASATTSLERATGKRFNLTRFFRDAFRSKPKPDKSPAVTAPTVTIVPAEDSVGGLQPPERCNTGPSSRSRRKKLFGSRGGGAEAESAPAAQSSASNEPPQTGAPSKSDYSRQNYTTITGGGGHSALTYHRVGRKISASGRVLDTIQQETAADEVQLGAARSNSKNRYPSQPTPSVAAHAVSPLTAAAASLQVPQVQLPHAPAGEDETVDSPASAGEASSGTRTRKLSAPSTVSYDCMAYSSGAFLFRVSNPRTQVDRLIISRDHTLANFVGVQSHKEGSPTDFDRAIVQFMRTHRCYDLIPPRSRLVVFDTQLTVKKAFYALLENGVRAAPLWDGAWRRLVGMLTVSDFISILTSYYKGPSTPMPEFEEQSIETWRSVHLAALGALRPFVAIEANCSLLECVKALLEHRIHRLPVLDPISHNALYILTHKRLLNYLSLYLNELRLPEAMGRTLEELKLGAQSHVFTAQEDTPLIDVLRLFIAHRLSALPILDPNGRLVDIYAKFDVLNLAAEKTYTNLDIPVREALRYRRDFFEGVVTCRSNETLRTIIERLHKKQVHRVVVVDNDSHVTGMVSLSDIFDFLVLRPDRERARADTTDN